MMNVIELINKIKNIALSQQTCVSFYDGNVHENWNSNECKYASVNIDIENISNTDNQTVYSCVIYYGDRLLQDKSNYNNIITDGANTIQSILNILNQDYSIYLYSEVEYTPFEEKFADFLCGVYTRIDITTDSVLGLCEMDEMTYEEEVDETPFFNTLYSFYINFLTNDLGWSETDAENVMEYIKNEYLNNPNSYISTTYTKADFNNLLLSKQLKDNWDSTTGHTDVSGAWRDNRFKGAFFPALNFDGVTNANRCLHTNYNTLFIPSLTFPDATNIGGMFFYDDCHWFGDLTFPSVTSTAYNNNMFYLSTFRNKCTISMENCTSIKSFGLYCEYWAIPTLDMPKLTEMRWLLSYSTIHGSFDIIKELDLNWGNLKSLYCAFYNVKQTSNSNSFIDLNNIDLSSLEDGRWMNASNGIPVYIPEYLDLPNLKQSMCFFGYDEGCENYSITDINVINISNADLSGFLAYMHALRNINELICTNCNACEDLVYDSKNIENIYKLTNLGNGFTTGGTTEEHTLNLSEQSKLKYSCIVSLFDSLGVVPNEVNDASIVLPEHILEVITPEVITIATNKNWSVPTSHNDN